MREPCHLYQAKPSNEEQLALVDFFNELEVMIEDRTMPDASEATEEAICEWLSGIWETIGPCWRRVLFAGMTAISNSCDPAKDALEWKPSIQEAIDFYQNQTGRDALA